MLNRTIVLVGLMGAGKTSVGRRLAARLDVRFVDSDEAIEEAARMTIPEIFDRLGEAEFRAGEARVIARLLAETPMVLATGGGAMVNPQTRAAILQSSLSVWLRAPLDVLWRRVSGRGHRPLVAGPDGRDVLARLAEERAPIYAEADLAVDTTDGRSPDDTAAVVLDAIRSNAPDALASRVAIR